MSYCYFDITSFLFKAIFIQKIQVSVFNCFRRHATTKAAEKVRNESAEYESLMSFANNGSILEENKVLKPYISPLRMVKR